jgi:hypothetical protein
MKKLVTLITLGCGLLLATTACFANKTNENASQTTSTDIKLSESNGHEDHGSSHGGMRMPEAAGAETTIAKLTADNIQSGAEANLVIDITAKNGQAIDKFETFQTKLMHLIIVSDNLQTFQHIHPIYKQKGRFEVQTNFPQGGNYTLVSDYKPVGKTEQVSLMQVKVTGKPAASATTDFTKIKSISDTKVTLTTDSLKAGKETMLVFRMQQANGQPITDLQPYLGERGHLVIMKNSTPLTRADYIHAHAVRHGTGEEVHFMTIFPKAGKYKMWGQFNRNGKIVTADFWVNAS